MSIDRIYREFSGAVLVIFSLFLIISLFSFSPQDDVQGFLPNETEYSNSLGYLGALFSSTMLFYLGYASYYFAFMLSYFGIVLFISNRSSNFFERLSLFNKFMFSLISIFPLAVFYASFFNSAGGMAGDNLLSSAETYLNKFLLN